MLYQPGQTPTLAEALASDDAYASMLTEVDFKWLLAGEGQWIDVIRFRCDFSYAADLIRLALLSPSFALRECAALLQTQNSFTVSQTLTRIYPIAVRATAQDACECECGRAGFQSTTSVITDGRTALRKPPARPS